MKRRTALAAVAALVMTAAGTTTAAAMGTGNPYQDHQVGVTYTVYQPGFVAGLGIQHVGGDDMCPPGVDQSLTAVYGKHSGRQFTLNEGNPMCFDIGNGATVLTTTINGAKATVEAYCDPSNGQVCKASDVLKYGGNLQMTQPGTGGLRPTQIWIETFGKKNLSAQQLIQIAKGLAPVG
ncbi:MAG: hypothetical protein F2840_02345 [Actinobacteria bacterium]|uniref:Unannotated protein n=1 Tax=freshwater metagenome TaxID=449393 RepID=A0A6J7IVU9_9ZZZZ|nr:hypothetical protein [Actinomycetota bacterium]